MENNETITRWGKYRVLESHPLYKVKILIIDPGKCISKQYHLKRSEIWTVINGNGLLLLDEKLYLLEPDDTYDITLGAVHQVLNPSNQELVILELQKGICLEEDIIRLSVEWGNYPSNNRVINDTQYDSQYGSLH